MINYLHVKNLALIDEAEIQFGEGLNILSGETGAGKSIIIGSLGLALGDRADSESIRTGAESALVELSVSTDDDRVWKKLREMDIEHDSDEIIIKRRIYPGRSDCRINGESVTLKQLSAVSDMLIDICGQRESQKLLKNSALRVMLDECGGAQIADLLAQVKTVHREYTDILCKLDEVDEDESLRKRKADLAAFEIEEIDSANLTVGEDIEVENNYRRMSHSAKIAEAVGMVLNICGYDEGSSGMISRALREIRSVSEYDDRLGCAESMLLDLDSLSSDLIRELDSYIEDNAYDPIAFAELTDRLNLINRLKDKYGSSIEAILQYRDKREDELNRYNDHENYLSELNKQKDMVYARLIKLCAGLHSLRSESACKLASRLINELGDMNFENCELKVKVEANPEKITASGYDEIDFEISMNPGEPLMSLSQVASGGELSRIMLAIKCVSADRDEIDTLVFDEIDTGISGVTAWKVGEKLEKLSGTHQVICITHQAQIAAHADKHFLISKSVDNGRTSTAIEPLESEGMITELARMMGSDEMSDAALLAARELKAKSGK